MKGREDKRAVGYVEAGLCGGETGRIKMNASLQRAKKRKRNNKKEEVGMSLGEQKSRRGQRTKLGVLKCEAVC